MIQFGKLHADGWVSFRLVNSVDLITPVTGKAYTDLTVKYWTQGATSKTAYAGLAAGDLKETGTGDYDLNIGLGDGSTTEWSAVGNYWVEIACTGCDTRKYFVIVTAVTMQEFMAAVPSPAAGVLLAATQSLYAPAKASDAMTLSTAGRELVFVECLRTTHNVEGTLYFCKSAAEGGNDASDGLLPSTAKIQPGTLAPTLSAGDAICILGNIDIGTGHVLMAANTQLFGMGEGVSRLYTSTADGYYCLVDMNNGCRVADLEIEHTAATMNASRSPIGTRRAITGRGVIERVYAHCYSDAFVNVSGGVYHIDAYDSLFSSNYEACVANGIVGGTPTADLHNCRLRVVAVDYPATPVNGIGCQNNGVVRMFGGSIEVGSAYGDTNGVSVLGAGRASLHGVDILTTASTTATDLRNSVASPGIIEVDGITKFDPAKVVGTITYTPPGAAILEDTAAMQPTIATNLDAKSSDILAAAGAVANTIPYAPNTAVVNTGGGAEVGSYATMAAHDANSYSVREVNSAPNDINIVVTRTVSNIAESPSVLRISGHYDGGPVSHYITVYAYNYTIADYDPLGLMLNRADDFDYVFALTTDHHDAATGEMKVKFLHTNVAGNTGHFLYIDWLSWAKTTALSAFGQDIAFIRGKVQGLTFNGASEVLGDVRSVANTAVSGVSDFKATGFATPTNVTDARDSIKGASNKDLSQVFTEIGAESPLGPGSTPRTYTVTHSGTGLPVAGVRVWVTTDSAGTVVVAGPLTTDALGVARYNGSLPMLDAGTYYFWCVLAGFNAVGPDTEVFT